MLLGDFAQRLYPLRVIVQAGDVVEFLATGMQERFTRLLVDLFQGFQAVAGEGRAHHIDTLHASFAHFDQRRFGVGLQPFGAAQAGLEGDLELVSSQAQLFRQQARGFETLAVIGVAQVQGALGHAMKTHHQHIGVAMRLPVVLHPPGQRGDVAGVVVVMIDKAQFGDVAHLAGPLVHRVPQAGGGGG